MGQNTVYFLFFLGFGVWAFFWGFKRLRRKRLIENIPTSTIRGLALGLVELIGKAKKEKPLKSPFTGIDCVLYRYTVERYEQRGKSGRWVIVARGDSFYSPFRLDDGSGQILIFPKDAELVMPVDYEFTSGWLKSIPQNLGDFMTSHGIYYKGFFGSYAMRFREWCITEDQSVYVLGTANKSGDFMEDHKEMLLKRISELKKDAAFMKEADADKDGNISQEEWAAAVSRVEQEVLQKELENGQNNNALDVVVSKAVNNQVFIISKNSQKELTQKLGMQATAGIFGGCILVLVMLYLILSGLFVAY
ncbi:MAG: GIDE domain-containing protein [Candidatus Omnitrophica bacterium]|nr:GIDE domain-containing protein [Candidatus Omnitrophota bacterium]